MKREKGNRSGFLPTSRDMVRSQSLAYILVICSDFLSSCCSMHQIRWWVVTPGCSLRLAKPPKARWWAVYAFRSSLSMSVLHLPLSPENSFGINEGFTSPKFESRVFYYGDCDIVIVSVRTFPTKDINVSCCNTCNGTKCFTTIRKVFFKNLHQF